MEKNGCKPGGCKPAVFCFKPDEKRDKQDEKNGMHELPVAKQVKELISGLMAYAVANEGKEDVWDDVQVRQNCQKCQDASLFSFEAESQSDQKADSKMRDCVYHLFCPGIDFHFYF